MTLDDFVQDDEGIDIEEANIQILGVGGSVQDDITITDTALIRVDDEVVKLKLEEQKEWHHFDENKQQKFISDVILQLARDRLDYLVHEKSPVDDLDNYEPVTKKGSKVLDVLLALLASGVSTRPELNDKIDNSMYAKEMNSLEDKRLVSRVTNEGRSIVWGLAPKGHTELLFHFGYDGLNNKIEEFNTQQQSEDENEEDEEDNEQNDEEANNNGEEEEQEDEESNSEYGKIDDFEN